MIRCAYCELFNSLECENKHKNFPNDEICKDFSLDPKRLDEVRLHSIQEMLIKYQGIDEYPSITNIIPYNEVMSDTVTETPSVVTANVPDGEFVVYDAKSGQLVKSEDKSSD